MKHYFPFLMASALVIFTGCGGDQAAADSAAPATEVDDRLAVTTLRIDPRPFVHSFSVQGNVEMDGLATVTAETPGTIEEILVQEGQRVAKGDPILRVDISVMERSLEELKTQLTLAEDLFSRQERLWSQEIGSEVEYLQAKAQVEALKNSRSTLLAQMDMAVVRAPFGGVVDRVFAKKGEMGAPGMPLARVVSLDNMYVRAMVSDHYAGRVTAGMPAEVIVSGVDTVATEVGRTGQFINPANRTIEVTLPLPKGTKFLPNMFASVRLQDVALDSAVVVPSALIQQDVNGRSFVYKVVNGQAEKALLEVEMGSGDVMWVGSGLAYGDQIIDKGAARVTNGEPVRILNQ